MMPVLPPRQREVLSAVILWPGLNACQLAKRLNAQPGTVHKAAARLERYGLITTRWNGRYRTAYPAPHVAA